MDNQIAINYIKILRSEWIARRVKQIERIDEYNMKGEEIVASALELNKDLMQHFISDLTNLIDQLDTADRYQKSCIELINNQFKK
tara:strand:- start:5458 stop:5712 length:255 start_codon:yes stop_codon:yes gene_type:complete